MPDHPTDPAFESGDQVVADTLRFKLRLGIGEDAYASLRLKRNLQSLYDIGSWGLTGGAIAASPAIASTFFPATGFLALVGLGTAVTPIGWVAAAAIGSAGAYYGTTRILGRYVGSRVDTIPKFINTPLDALGATLFEMMGALAVGIVATDHVRPARIEAIADHFVREWGYDAIFTGRTLTTLAARAGTTELRGIARQLAAFLALNPDCNAPAIQAELLAFLREVAEAEGAIDERASALVDHIAGVMAGASTGGLARAGVRGARALTAMQRTVGRAIGRLLPPRPRA